MRGPLVAEADGVHRQAPVAQGVERVELDASAVFGAIAEQHHGTYGQVRRLCRQLPQAIVDVRCGRGRLDRGHVRCAGQAAIQPVDAGLEALA